MKLIDWIAQENRRPVEFAREVGVTRACMSGYMLGKFRPSSWRARRIEQLTGGAVTEADWAKE